jgi:NADH:ubiquinone oxidoreductase subunit C
MEKIVKNFKGFLIEQGFDAIETDHDQRGYHLEVVLTVNQVRDFAKKAYELGFYLVFVTGFQVRPDEQNDSLHSGLAVVYQFARYDRQYRMKALALVPISLEIPSISDIYHGADWHERETRDLYGIIFSGHPNLKPLLLSEEDGDFHPLLKEETQLKSLHEVSWSSGSPENDKQETGTETDG